MVQPSVLKNWKETRISFFELSVCPKTSQIMLVQTEKLLQQGHLPFMLELGRFRQHLC